MLTDDEDDDDEWETMDDTYSGKDLGVAGEHAGVFLSNKIHLVYEPSEFVSDGLILVWMHDRFFILRHCFSLLDLCLMCCSCCERLLLLLSKTF